MTDIEPVEFNAESRLWVRHADLQLICGFDDPKSLDKWRVKFENRHEHKESRGPNRGVWFYLPAWLPAWADARRAASAPAAADDSEATPKQRKEAASARLVELQVAERERELDANWARKDAVMDEIMGVFAVFHSCGERMCGTCKQILSDGFSELDHQHLHRNGKSGGHRKVSPEGRAKSS